MSHMRTTIYGTLPSIIFCPVLNCPAEFEVISCVHGVVSPLLANVYLHYVLDLWAQQWRKRNPEGNIIVVRYADDVVFGFEHQGGARRFLGDLEARMRKFGLALHPEKTRLIEFGRFAVENRKRRGLGKPETLIFSVLPICVERPTP